MRRCEDVKMFDRPPLLEEPFAQTLSGTTKARKRYFPALLCNTKLAQSTTRYYFVLQSLHKALPSTTLYYKACTKSFPVLLCTTMLQSLHKALPSTTWYYKASQYYFVLQSLHKARSSTTLYYKACTKHFPVLLCTTKLAQSTSQHYFVLRSRPSTTLYYKSLHKVRPSTTL